ncbi:arginine N-succinyltransferase [Pseudoalteromonas sp. SSDWG2]|uniref:arginine N-succinyltransferase n=1 Tax=Pseudoalteromonas sp. SSDWG2 TaxID=3139391 RepID=UPI003BA9CA72
MMVLRPIQQEDFQELLVIAEESGHGFTSLPLNEELLRNKINRSVESFSKPTDKAGDEGYLFVLEDSETGEIAGTCGIEAAVGLDDAFYHYHLSKVIHSSRTLGVYKAVDILTLCNDYTGATELCTLFLKEKFRQKYNGKLLSKSRFLFIDQHRERFAPTVIAEMRGVSDENGNSPFWQWLEEHFFSMDFPTADYLTGIGQKVFIAELMPKYPIYVNLLSQDAQKVVGEVHPNTRPAIEMLKSEGFTFNGYVDIFDAGPTVEAKVENIRTVMNSSTRKVIIGENAGDTAVMVANQAIDQFRAVVVEIDFDNSDDTHIILSQQTAQALKVSEGDSVCVAAL